MYIYICIQRERQTFSEVSPAFSLHMVEVECT